MKLMNFSLLARSFCYQDLTIKQNITNGQVFIGILYFFKFQKPIFIIFFFFFFCSPLDSTTICNILAVSSSVVFYSNAVLMDTFNSLIKFLKFFSAVLPTALTTITGTTLANLIFHILYISLLNPDVSKL